MKKTNTRHSSNLTKKSCEVSTDKRFAFLEVYKFIQEQSAKKKALTDFPSDDVTKIYKAFTNMQVTIIELKEKGWINQDSHIQDEIEKARRKIERSLSWEIFRSWKSEELRRLGYWKDKEQDIRSTKRGIEHRIVRTRGRKENDAFNIILYLLGSDDKKKKRGEIIWSDIALFLDKNDIPLPKITKSDNVNSALKKQFGRLQQTDIKELYEKYRRHSVRGKPNPKGKRIIIYHLLPTWEELTSK